MPPSDSVPRIGAASALGGAATRTAAQTAGTSTAAANSAATSTGDSATDYTAPIHPNPAAVLDPASGLIVMEFRDAEDQVVRTVPSRQQIDAYENTQRGQATGQAVGHADARAAASDDQTFHGTATMPADPADISATAANPVSDAAGMVATAQAALAGTDAAGSVVQTASTTGT